MSYRIVHKPLSNPRVRRSVLRILQENVLCSMATVTPGKRPYINTAYFCYSPDLELYFLSAPISRHARNLERDRALAMAVFRTSQTWGTPNRGLQLFGTCREAKGHEAEEAERLYGQRFPRYAGWTQGTLADQRRAARQLRSYRFYRFLPREVKVLDEREFGGAVFVVARIPRRRA